MAVPAIMLVVAGFFLWEGIAILTDPGGNVPAWVGWICIAVAVLKASLWSFVAVHFVRHRDVVIPAVRSRRFW